MSGASDLAVVFQHPPEAARPWVYWYWMNAAVTHAGITADLQAMQEAGIGGAYLMPLKSPTQPPLVEPPAIQLGSVWWDDVRFAVAEADRLGVKLALHACDGFATAGGPWITPELSMQKVVWSETQLDGARAIDVALPQPPANENYYRDIAVLAFPAPVGAGVSSLTAVPVVTTSAAGATPQFLAAAAGMAVFRSDAACWIQYAFREPFTCRAVTVRAATATNTYYANRFAIEVSDDGEHFRRAAQLVPPRHGWEDGDADVTHAIPAVTARFFRFLYDPAGAEAGAEDVDSAKWDPALKLRALELSAAPRLHEYEGKSGAIWRIAPATTTEQAPTDRCVPLAEVVDLSAFLDAAGRLTWQAPPGRWTVLRIGHTSTGKTNYVGGGGLGLECDKFNPTAVRLQFDGWFGETIRQVGPELAGRVLKIFHVDSWECGSQNWSPVFRAEFQQRRGYDPLRYLPAMAGVPVQSAAVSERFLRDVRETIAELLTDNFFRTLAGLAHEHGCEFSAESVAPTMMSDGLAHYSAVDLPMGEFWLRSPTHDKLNDVLDAVSGAHIYGRPIAQSEAFTELRLAWDEHPAMLKALADRNYCLGINRFVFHVFAHNPWLDRQPGMTLSGVGLYFQRDQTWWRPGRAWVDYVQRCQAVLQEGRPVADVAVFTGDAPPSRAVVPWQLAETLPGFFPSPDLRRAKKIIEAGDWIDPLHGYAYDSINRDALLRLARVRDGRIELPGGASYALLIVPAANRMSPSAAVLTPETAERLRLLVEAGATVLLGERTAAQTAAALWPTGSAADGSIHAVGNGRVITGPWRSASFERAGLVRDVIATQANGTVAEGLAWTHRRGDGGEVYFISSQRDAGREVTLSLRVIGCVPELWNPVTGEMRPARTWRMRDGRTALSLRLPANGSLFVVLRTATANTVDASGNYWAEPALAQTIAGEWRVVFDPVRRGPKGALVFPRLISWAERPEDGVRHYSGTASYSRTFSWQPVGPVAPARVWLDLGRVANLAEVSVNGVPCGVAWTPPFRVDVTAALQAGDNQLRVDVTNTWFNRLAGDRALPEPQRLTWTAAPERTEGKPLLEAGLLGPVTLLTE